MKEYLVRISFILFSIICLDISAQTPFFKVDLNIGERQEAEVNEPGYIPWPIYGGADSMTLEGVKITFKNGAVSYNWYKAGVQAPNYARLANDGIATDSVEMHISGLQNGKHTLVTFHNTFDNPETNTFSPMDVYLNDSLVIDDLELSNRVLNDADATTAFFEFEVENNETVILRFKSDPKWPDANIFISICGFHLNYSNPDKMAKYEYPENYDEHVDIDNDTLVFRWEAPVNTVSQNVYFGKNRLDIFNADTTSELYIGNLTDAFFVQTGFYSMDEYYWRVDPINSEGETTKGDVWYFKKRIRSFPGAEGYGGYALGGRGGKVVYVTNLNNDGPGSFREAVTSDIGPRTVLFNVSGIIRLESRLVMDEFVTIAGQTAPGKGICFRAAPLGISHECICRFIRMRLGAGTTADGIGMAGVNNGIIDHCSISWAIDECFSSRNAKNITLQRTLISEALSVAGHKNYEEGFDHGYAGSISGDIGSFHHNLLAHCSGRNWSLAGGYDGDQNWAGRMDIFNMVVYNWSKHACYNGAKDVNFYNNYYKIGPATEQTVGTHIMLAADTSPIDPFDTTQQSNLRRYYFNGNVMPGVFDESNQEDGRMPQDYETVIGDDTIYIKHWADEPLFPSYAKTQTAGEAYKNVLSDVGCTQPVFDDHDKRIINETLTGTYTYVGSKTGHYGLIDDEADAGGYEEYPAEKRLDDFDTDLDGLPDWWETLFGSNINSAMEDYSDTHADPDLDGYTALEDYLYWMSVPHFYLTENVSKSINLSILTRGYENAPEFITAKSNENLNIEYNDTSATITSGVEGIHYFDFKVRDAEGDTMIRTVGICVGAVEPETVLSENYAYKKNNLSINVYPNPVHNILNISFESDINTALELYICDILGQVLIQDNYNSHQGPNTLDIDISELNPGIYILNIKNGNRYNVVRLIKR